MGEEASSEGSGQGSMGASSGLGVDFTASHIKVDLLESRTYWCLTGFHWEFREWFRIFLSNLERPREDLPQGVIYARKKIIFHHFTCLEDEF